MAASAFLAYENKSVLENNINVYNDGGRIICRINENDKSFWLNGNATVLLQGMIN